MRTRPKRGPGDRCSRAALARTLLAALCLLGTIVPAPGQAQSFPARPVRLVVGFAPGGANDIVGRTLAHKLTELIGQQVVVENRAGANGVIANTGVAKAPPDGYTLLLVPASFSYDMSLRPDLPYNTRTDFTPVSLVATAPFILLAHPSFPAQTVQDLVRLAKASPGKVAYAHGGVGNLTQLAAELFNSMAGIRLVGVPYRGTGPGLVDLMAGQLPVQVAAILSTVPHVKSGRVRALAVTSAGRSSVLPDVPSIAESGFAGYDASGWWAVVAPRGLASDPLAVVNRAIGQALRSADVRERLLAYGAVASPTTPEGIAAHIENQSSVWARVIRDAGIRLK